MRLERKYFAPEEESEPCWKAEVAPNTEAGGVANGFLAVPNELCSLIADAALECSGTDGVENFLMLKRL